STGSRWRLVTMPETPPGQRRVSASSYGLASWREALTTGRRNAEGSQSESRAYPHIHRRGVRVLAAVAAFGAAAERPSATSNLPAECLSARAEAVERGA